MNRTLNMQPCTGADQGVGMTKASRELLGVEVGDIVRIDNDGNSIQRAVRMAPKRAVALEALPEEYDRPLCVMHPSDWKFLNLDVPDSGEAFKKLSVTAEKADDQVEMP